MHGACVRVCVRAFLGDRYAFLGVDLFLNAVCDHVFYDINTNVNNRRLSACQIIIQVLTFFSLLLLMFDTYPYEVGLIGILTKSNSVFRLLLVVAPLYLVISAIAVGFRVSVINRFSVSTTTTADRPSSLALACTEVVWLMVLHACVDRTVMLSTQHNVNPSTNSNTQLMP